MNVPAPVAPVAPRIRRNRFHEIAGLHDRLHRFRSILRKRWWLVALPVLVCGTLAYLYATLWPQSYESHALMWMTGKINIPEGVLYSEETSTFIGTQSALLQSEAVQLRAFHRVPKAYQQWLLTATNRLKPPRFPFDLRVKDSPKSAALELQVFGRDPETTQAFLDAVMDEYLRVRRDARGQSSKNALVIITDQLKAMENQIQQQQDKIMAFQASNNVVFLAEQGAGATSQLARVSKQLTDLRLEAGLLQMLTPDQLKEIGPRNGGNTGGGLMSDAPPPGESSARDIAANLAAPQADYYRVMQDIQIRKAKVEELSKNLRPTHSKIIRLNQEIASLQTLVDMYQHQSLTQMSNRLQSVKMQTANLQTNYDTLETKAVASSRKMAEFDRLKEDLHRSESLYDKLLSLVQTVDINKNLDQESLSILAPASAPLPTRRPLVVIIFGILAGGFVGFGLLLLVESLNDRFASISELRESLAEPVLGQIPDNPVKSLNGRPGPSESVESQHAFVESFRNLRSSLLFSFAESASPKAILVTSAVPKEGKTTVAANLASTLAFSGARVLLIDADLRRGGLHRIFGVESEVGFVDFLSNGTPQSQVIIATKQSNLYVLPAGRAKGSVGELFLSPRAAQFFAEVKRQFDYVLVDSAPILATDDSASLAPKMDGVLVVVRASFTSARMTREALSRLHQRNVNVLGLIYNRAAPSGDYYQRYRKQYGRAPVPKDMPLLVAPK